ncbi:MAG: hypothetical protein AB7G28_17285, partial [Pirellulales bacterium]
NPAIPVLADQSNKLASRTLLDPLRIIYPNQLAEQQSERRSRSNLQTVLRAQTQSGKERKVQKRI